MKTCLSCSHIPQRNGPFKAIFPLRSFELDLERFANFNYGANVGLPANEAITGSYWAEIHANSERGPNCALFISYKKWLKEEYCPSFFDYSARILNCNSQIILPLKR